MKIKNKLGIEILKLSILTIISILLSNASGIVDLFFVSNLPKNSQRILGLIFPFQACVQAIGYLIGHGGGIVYSKDNNSKIIGKKIIIMGLIIGFIFSLIGIFSSYFIDNSIFKYYFIIISISSLFLISEVIINNLLRFNKSVIGPMFILLIGFIINFVFDYYFIRVLDIGIIGNYLSFLISHLILFILFLFFYIFRTKNNSSNEYNISFFNIIKLGLPSFIYQGLTSLSIFVITMISKGYGDDFVIVINICNRIYYLLLAIPYGIGQAIMPLVLQKRKGVYLISSIYILLFLLVEIPLIIFSNSIISFFVINNDLYQKYLIFFLLAIPFISISILVNIILQCNSNIVISSILALLRTGGLFIPLVLLLNVIIGINCIYLAKIISDILVFGASIIISIKYKLLSN